MYTRTLHVCTKILRFGFVLHSTRFFVEKGGSGEEREPEAILCAGGGLESFGCIVLFRLSSCEAERIFLFGPLAGPAGLHPPHA